MKDNIEVNEIFIKTVDKKWTIWILAIALMKL